MARTILKAVDVERLENTSFASALPAPEADLAAAAGDSECSCGCRIAVCDSFVCDTGVHTETWYQNTTHTYTGDYGDTGTIYCEGQGVTTLVSAETCDCPTQDCHTGIGGIKLLLD